MASADEAVSTLPLYDEDQLDNSGPEGDAPDFRSALTTLLNRFSRENVSNTPDWILRNFICECLKAFNVGIVERDKWYGIKPEPGDAHANLKQRITKHLGKKQ